MLLMQKIPAERQITMTTKGYKITDAQRKSRVGVAVKNFDDLKKKTIDKFKLPHSPNRIKFQTSDGTVVENDEYFQTLPPQTLLIWMREGETAETDAEILYRTIREVNEEYLKAGEKVQEFFTEKMKSKVFKLAEVLKGIDEEKSNLSTRSEHPEWFEGLDTRAKTKEDYLFKRAQDRIRTYYYKTKEDLVKAPDLPHAKLHELLTDLQSKLKLNKYHGTFFDRQAAAAVGRESQLRPLCDVRGVFTCHGRWDKDLCLYTPQHRINPYTSREERIIFQTWNLDHQIERSRSVIPAVIDALRHNNEGILEKNNGSRLDAVLDVKGIYNDLFTMHNLKFVHIVCHDKGAHSLKKAGPYLIA